MASVYPIVRDEHETLRRVSAGASIARYGDGEFKICRGGDAVAQAFHPTLSRRLRDILVESGSCMVGIPNLNQDAVARMDNQKRHFWTPYAEAQHMAIQFLAPRPYASAFITRPDSAPWIDTSDYWRQVEALWLGRDVTLVRGSSKGLTSEDLMGAGLVSEIICPRQQAYAEYDSIIERVTAIRTKRALLCLGPTATPLAVDLAARGIHAIDLGHIALFLRKFRRGEPMTLSKNDKSHDKVPVV